MKILTLYSTSVKTNYKNSICSRAAFFIFLSTVFIVIAPLYLIIYISNDLWYQPKIFYEQPTVSFQYKYILLGEHGSSDDNNEYISGVADGGTSSSSLAVISSFGYFNEITEPWQKRSTVRFWKEDFDHNNIADRLHFQFTYESLPEPLTYLNVFLELDAYIEKHHCKLHIPSAVILSKEQLPPNFRSGHISYEGKLNLKQKSSFHCPYFMRNVKSNFYFELIPSNSTIINDYLTKSIHKKLTGNVGFMMYEKTSEMWDRGSGDDNIKISLSVDIGEIRTRFHATFWQKLMLFWTEYLAVLVVFAFCFNKLKFYLFSRQVLRAWEIIPWKKVY